MRCGWCSQSAEGFAEISGRRYCHEGSSPTCYESASRDEALSRAASDPFLSVIADARDLSGGVQ